MPEWYIQRVERFGEYAENYDAKRRYYIVANEETWDLYDLHYKKIKCKITRILDSSGKTMKTIQEEYVIRCIHTKHFPSQYSSDYQITSALILPDEFVKSYGIRIGDYLDLTLLSIVSGQPQKDSESIFPKANAIGKLAINPSQTNVIIPSNTIVENLIEHSIQEPFYDKLIDEINTEYAYEHIRSTHVLLRTLFENLILKLLKTKFQATKTDLFLTKKGHILEFSKLIDNFKNNKHEFVPYNRPFDDEFFDFLDKFRESANSSTHILEMYLDKEKIDKDKKKMNHYIKVIDSVINEVEKMNKI